MQYRSGFRWCVIASALFVTYPPAQAAENGSCQGFKIDGKKSEVLPGAAKAAIPPQRRCAALIRNGFPIPDPGCTPGAINPDLTSEVLRNPDFTTKCVRDNATTETQKAETYGWYALPHPDDNRGVKQTCELDHLISLELGGADTLDNIWPQCGPPGVILTHRYFKEKDSVENYLAKQVRDGAMELATAQKGIATDWTQYLPEAQKACLRGNCR